MRLIFSPEAMRFVEPAEYWASRPVPKRSGLPAPQLIRDSMPSIVSHADGKRYDSKSAYYRGVKEAGCEVVGNDSSFAAPKRPEIKSEGVAQDIKRSIEQLGG